MCWPFSRLPTHLKRSGKIKPMTYKTLILATVAAAFLVTPALAQTKEDPAVTACKATGLIALQAKSPDITDIVFDMESLAVSAADTKVEDVSVKTVVLGEAYLSRKGVTGKSDRFVCLLGDKGKVLLTFFTAQ